MLKISSMTAPVGRFLMVAVGSLRRAAVAGSEVDDLFNLTVHPDTNVHLLARRLVLGASWPLIVGELGPVQESFKLLGVHYSTEARQ